MNRAAIACSLLFLFTSPLFASPKSVIAGRVVDSEGAVIANARVLVHWDSSGSTVGLTDNIGLKNDVSAITDANGRYSVRLPAGFYDVFVSAMAFTPTAAKVRVKRDQPTTFDTSLRPDPLVSNELAHKLVTTPSQP